MVRPIHWHKLPTGFGKWLCDEPDCNVPHMEAKEYPYANRDAIGNDGEENEGLRHENDQLRQELEDTRKHFRSFTSFVATCQRENNQDWMRMLLDWLNGVCQRVESRYYFVLDGSKFAIVNHGQAIEAVQVGEDEGVPVYTEVEARRG